MKVVKPTCFSRGCKSPGIALPSSPFLATASTRFVLGRRLQMHQQPMRPQIPDLRLASLQRCSCRLGSLPYVPWSMGHHPRTRPTSALRPFEQAPASLLQMVLMFDVRRGAPWLALRFGGPPALRPGGAAGPVCREVVEVREGALRVDEVDAFEGNGAALRLSSESRKLSSSSSSSSKKSS